MSSSRRLRYPFLSHSSHIDAERAGLARPQPAPPPAQVPASDKLIAERVSGPWPDLCGRLRRLLHRQPVDLPGLGPCRIAAAQPRHRGDRMHDQALVEQLIDGPPAGWRLRSPRRSSTHERSTVCSTATRCLPTSPMSPNLRVHARPKLMVGNRLRTTGGRVMPSATRRAPRRRAPRQAASMTGTPWPPSGRGEPGARANARTRRAR